MKCPNGGRCWTIEVSQSKDEGHGILRDHKKKHIFAKYIWTTKQLSHRQRYVTDQERWFPCSMSIWSDGRTIGRCRALKESVHWNPKVPPLQFRSKFSIWAPDGRNIWLLLSVGSPPTERREVMMDLRVEASKNTQNSWKPLMVQSGQLPISRRGARETP